MNLNSEYSILYIVFSLISAIFISFFYYRKSNISNSPKIILLALRASGIFSILILLFLSFLTFNKKTTDKSVNVFLIDDSKSLMLENRREELNKSLEIIKSIGNNISENKYYLFSNDILGEKEKKDISNISEENINNESTNLAQSINTISKILGNKKISSINIVSDGIFNSGGNPHYSVQYPDAIFNYLLIGDTIQKSDLSIKNVFFNQTVYTESTTKIFVEFNSYNYNKEIKINLLEEGIPIQEKKVIVNTENTLYSCLFNIKSNSEGIKRYKVHIENVQNEITDKNNSEEFFVEFINNKFKLLVISGNPSADFSYLAETIKKINNFEAKLFVQKASGVFYEGQLPTLNEFNLLILINFPTVVTDLNTLSKINDDLKNVNLPVFFISGSNTDYERLKILNNYLPFSSVNKSGSEEKTPLKFIDDLSSEINNLFNFKKTSSSLQEILIPGFNFSLIPESRTLLYSSKFSKPVLITSRNGDRNSAAFLAYNFYKWRLDNSNNESKNFLGELLAGVTLSISEKEKNKKIFLNLEKQIYSAFEQIKINGTLNTAESTSNTSIKMQIYNSSFAKDIESARTSNNSFSCELRDLKEGEYFVKCILVQNGNEIAYDIKKILVKESNLEYKYTKSDNSILNILSKNSDGGIISEQNLDAINKKIETRNKEDASYQNNIYKFYLNSSIFVLFFIIIILSTEWFIRKRLNLP